MPIFNIPASKDPADSSTMEKQERRFDHPFFKEMDKSQTCFNRLKHVRNLI